VPRLRPHPTLQRIHPQSEIRPFPPDRSRSEGKRQAPREGLFQGRRTTASDHRRRPRRAHRRARPPRKPSEPYSQSRRLQRILHRPHTRAPGKRDLKNGLLK